MTKIPGVLACAAVLGALSCAEGGAVAQFGTTDLGGLSDAIVAKDGTVALPDVPLQDGQTCHPGESKCMGSVFLVCNQAGTDWMSVACPAGTTCTPTGCSGAIVSDAVEPPTDTSQPADPGTQPNDPGTTPVDPGTAPVDPGTAPVDPGTAPVDPGTAPVDTYVAPDCGNDGPCPPDQECCKTLWGSEHCVPKGECNAPAGDCETDADCDEGLKCCKGFTGSTCREQCWGGGGTDNLPTCEADADCTGGQTCVNLTLTKLCLTPCEADGDCVSGTCKAVEALGYTLAKVCGCADDGQCGTDLKCCKVPLVDLMTCLEQCSGN